jgi:hypothetical protein
MPTEKRKVYISFCPKKLHKIDFKITNWRRLVMDLRAKGYNVINPFFAPVSDYHMDKESLKVIWRQRISEADCIFVLEETKETHRVAFELKVAKQLKLEYLNKPPTKYELAYEKFLKKKGKCHMGFLASEFDLPKDKLSRYIVRRYTENLKDGKRPEHTEPRPRKYWGRIVADDKES